MEYRESMEKYYLGKSDVLTGQIIFIIQKGHYIIQWK